ncbi:MAG: M23 family metallopeptidase [Actinomycetota bacterium]
MILTSRLVRAMGVAAAAMMLIVAPMTGVSSALSLADESIELSTGSLPGTDSSTEIILEEDPVGDLIKTVTETVEDTLDPSEPPPDDPEQGGGDTDPDPSHEDGTEPADELPSDSSTNPNAANQELTVSSASASPASAPLGGAPVSALERTLRLLAAEELEYPPMRRLPGDSPRRGPRSTAQVIEILEGLGLSEAEIARIIAPFPILGPASYGDDWGNPRYQPYFHLHEGTDIFAPRGTPVIASSDGVVTRMATNSKVGGTSLRLTAADGTYYYYAHLDRFDPGLDQGQRVKAGEVLGFVGTSGNAEGGAPHLHYEIHPDGGAAVPPVPYLDRWLAEALATAKSLEAAPAPKGLLSAIGDRVLKFAYRAGETVQTAILNQPLTGSVAAMHAASWAGVLVSAVGLWMWGRRRRAAWIGQLRE